MMKNGKIDKNDLRKFGVVLSVVLGAFGVIHMLKGNMRIYPSLFAVAAVILTAAIFVPLVLRPVYRLFIKVTHAIGWFNSRVILIAVYYFLVVPVGFLMRIFSKDPMKRRIDKNADSYWIERKNISTTVRGLEKQF